MEVRILPCAPLHQGVGEPGRPCLPWKQETGGSNPPTLTNLMPVSSAGRAPLSESGCPRFKSATGCQPTRCPSGQGALCKSAHAGSIPALVSKLQWLERRGTDLLNRQMLVRIQPGAPLIRLANSTRPMGDARTRARGSAFPWPRSSKDERRFPTSEDARSTRVAASNMES